MPFDAEGHWISGDGSQAKYTADAVIAEQDGEGSLDAERAKQAKANGVSRAAYIAYAEVLENYANRSDVEPLADRRARHQGEALTDADFTRHADYTGDNKGAVTGENGGAGHTTRLNGAGTIGVETEADLEVPPFNDDEGAGDGEGEGEGETE